MAGKKNKKGGGGGGDGDGKGKENQPKQGQPGAAGGSQQPQQGAQAAQQQGRPQQGPASGQQPKKTNPQQSSGGDQQTRPQQGQQGPGGGQQKGAWGQKGDQQDRPQQGPGGGQPQGTWGQKGDQQNRPHQGPGGRQPQGGWGQKGDQQGRPQQGPGGGQPQGGWGQKGDQQGRPQQGPGGGQPQGTWGQKGDQQNRPHQGPGGGQPQGGWGQKGDQQGRSQQGPGGGQPQGGWGQKGDQQGRPQQGPGGGQPQGGLGQRGDQQGRPQQGAGRGQQKGTWGQKPQQGAVGDQPQGGWGQRGDQAGPQQGPGGGQQKGSWGQRGDQQGPAGGQGQGQRGDQQGPAGGQGRGQRGDQQGPGGGQGRGQRGDQQWKPQQGHGGGQQQGPGPRPQQDYGGGHQYRAQERGAGDADTRSQAGSSRSQSVMSQASDKPTGPIYVASDVPLNKGTVGKVEMMETNYVDLGIDKMINKAYHYDVKIDPDKPKKFMPLAFEAFKRIKFPQIELGYDGKASAYSPVKLDPSALSTLEVIVIEPDSKREKKYKVTMKETEDSLIDLSSLRTYQKDRIFDKPMRAMQCLEVVLNMPCSQKGVRAGRSFYNKPDRLMDLGDGYELWLGLFQAAVLGDKPYLNIDVSHKAFPSEMSLVDYIRNDRYMDLNHELDQRNAYKLIDFLKGLNLIYKPPPQMGATPKTFKFNDVKDSCRRQTFTLDDGTKLTVEKYFQSKGCPLQYPNMPCIHVGSSIKTVYVPLEFLSIPAGQATLKNATENQVRGMIRYAATSTNERKEKIMKLFNFFRHNESPVVQAFGIRLGLNFIQIKARILLEPRMMYKDNQIVAPRNGSWRLDNQQFLKTESNIIKFNIIVLDRNTRDGTVHAFAKEIINISKKLNMNFDKNYGIEILSNARDLNPCLAKMKQNKVDLVFVVLSSFPDSYSKVKQEAEIRNGVLTQCIKPFTLMKKGTDIMTIKNILLKLNAKLNGINHIIDPSKKNPILNDFVMFVGADVTHPSPGQSRIPSVVGVAASHDRYGASYNIQYRLQDPKKEIIESMEEILLHHLNVYKNAVGQFPNKIIYYRDGVADGQFPLVSKGEFRAMDAACSRIPNYRPSLTCIIVQKRHHTRFFPSNGIGKFNNVRPGTIVDTTITHPNESQFFLVSHESIQGTAKPTKYCVIRDDAKLNIDQLQALSYELCHLFPRCNRAVSYPAPAYLAHLVAARGRVYIEGPNLDLRNLRGEYSKRLVRDEIIKGHPMYFV